MPPVISQRILPDFPPMAARSFSAVPGPGNRCAKLRMASLACLMVGILTFISGGCASTSTQLRLIRASAIATESLVSVRKVRRLPRFPLLYRIATNIPGPSERTELLLRKYNLTRQYDQDPEIVIQWLQQWTRTSPSMAGIHGLAEIAEIQASWSEAAGDSERAARLYATAVIHAYQFLFDSKLDLARTAYDPHFRDICDIYNRALEALIRDVIVKEGFKQGNTILVGNGQQAIELKIEFKGRWRDQEFARFELVSDYEAHGIDNQHHTYGLGVPLIAVRKHQDDRSQLEKYYPPEITIPMTAFLHLLSDPRQNSNQLPLKVNSDSNSTRQAVLTLYDPLEQTLVTAESQTVPLESDITTPLAYGLRDPFINKEMFATASLINAEFAPDSHGLFMLEPFDPDKIPVVLVHGFWSSPVTWFHMYNDLLANQDIRENCQFWFYSYPTGQPFWVSAQQMRRDLAKIRQEVDPVGDAMSLDQMVLVGHSMGGLMSIMQTIDSGDEFWKTISDESIESLKGDPDVIELVRDTFYFRRNRSVDRVITLATPFRGSEFSNMATQWVSKKLFTLPSILTNDFGSLAKQNKDKLKSTACLTTMTSIDSLAPGHPMLKAVVVAQQSNPVKTHNIIGRLESKSFFNISSKPKTLDGDGVVSIESATNEMAETEKFVAVEHSDIHQHIGSIAEVQRILLQHLAEHNRIRPRQIPEIPGIRQAANPRSEAGNNDSISAGPTSEQNSPTSLYR